MDKIEFIAEVGVNHEGDLSTAKQLIISAAQAGCDVVKFQTYKSERLASENAPAYWDLEKEETKNQRECNFFMWHSKPRDPYLDSKRFGTAGSSPRIRIMYYEYGSVTLGVGANLLRGYGTVLYSWYSITFTSNRFVDTYT